MTCCFGVANDPASQWFGNGIINLSFKASSKQFPSRRDHLSGSTCFFHKNLLLSVDKMVQWTLFTQRTSAAPVSLLICLAMTLASSRPVSLVIFVRPNRKLYDVKPFNDLAILLWRARHTFLKNFLRFRIRIDSQISDRQFNNRIKLEPINVHQRAVSNLSLPMLSKTFSAAEKWRLGKQLQMPKNLGKTIFWKLI